MALAAAVVVMMVASVCPLSLSYPARSWGASSFFRQYTIALGETVTVQSPGFPTSAPPSAKYGWNVLCLPSASTTLLINCYVNLEDTPLCFSSSLTIKTDGEDRRLCGKEPVEDFVSATGFVRFEFASESKAIGQGFTCNAKCQAPEEVGTVSPTTPGEEANAATGTLEGDEEGSLELETGSDDGAGDLETVTDDTEDLESVTDDAGGLETVTDDAEDLESVTDDADDLETVIDDAENLETVTDEAKDLETVTDDAENLEAVADDAENFETVTGDAEELETVTDEADDLESLPGFADDLKTVTDFAEDLETETDDAVDPETETVGAESEDL